MGGAPAADHRPRNSLKLAQYSPTGRLRTGGPRPNPRHAGPAHNRPARTPQTNPTTQCRHMIMIKLLGQTEMNRYIVQEVQ